MRSRLYAAVAAAAACTVAVAALAALSPDTALRAQARTLFQPISVPPMPPKGSAREAQVLLGRMLFHDPRLSKSGVISCNTCHNMATYGVDALPTSLGHGFVAGPRNAPTVLNAALHTRQFWDGRARDVEEQALGPILNPKEMAMPASDAVIERVASIPEYVRMFRKAFPNQANPVSYRNVGVAIGAFERMLLTPSRFDQFLRGDNKALTAREKAGLKKFLDIGCAACHAGPAMGGMVFRRFRVPSDGKDMDLGRFEVTKDPNDRYAFKAYSLRNVARTYPYFHDGSVWDLGEAVRLMAKVQHNKDLSPQAIGEIVAFLNALTGDIPKVGLELPVLPPSSPRTPRPEL